jgi:outer membrane biosynthesis protein TonB
MGRLSAPPIILALAAAAALGLAACGSEDAELLPGDTASEINTNLDSVRQLADEQDCVGAADAAATVSAQIESLGGVDAELKRALSEGAARLNEVVASCDEEAEPEEEEPAVEPEEEPEEEEKPDRDQRQEEKEAEKEAKKAETSPSLPPQAEGKAKGHEKQEEEAPPVEPGGGTPSGGVSPGAAVEGSDEEGEG